ncbi:MAG: hypothetical protein Q4C60_07500 [Eubacteriales bacterium]|nr:hypothetical protein [Eubacteriales bacterium]
MKTNNSAIRKGKISSINYETGMVRVTYSDRGDAVTAEIPMVNNGEEYRMPKIGQDVLVAHLSNGSSRAVVLGTIWNQKEHPYEYGEGVYRKDLSNKRGVAYIKYDDATGEYMVRAAKISIDSVDETVIQGPHLKMEANLTMRQEAAETTLVLPVVRLEGNMEISGADAQVEMRVKGYEVQSGEALALEAGESASISAGETLTLRDKEYTTTLKEIMDRLKALDGGS